jgi:hypothetical protein
MMSIKDLIAEIKILGKSMKRSFSKEEAQDLWNQMGLQDNPSYSLEEFWLGLNVELEHGTKGNWDITNNDPIMTAKIALAHMDESLTYYKDLKKYVDVE